MISIGQIIEIIIIIEIGNIIIRIKGERIISNNGEEEEEVKREEDIKSLITSVIEGKIIIFMKIKVILIKIQIKI